MSVRVRLFAALRDAAGTAETTATPGALSALLESLCEQFGERFRACLPVATVMVDGVTVPTGEPCDVADGAEVVLLPPVSGGAAHGGQSSPLGVPAP